MTAKAPRSTTPASRDSKPHVRHAVGDLFCGKVITVLPKEYSADSDTVPFALLIKFDNTVGYHHRRSLNCAANERDDFMKKARVGDTMDVAVNVVTGSEQKPRYELSQKMAAALIAARARIGEAVTLHVLEVEHDGVLGKFEKKLLGSINVSELGSRNQEQRLAGLKRDSQVRAVIVSVSVDSVDPERLRFELSEVEAQLKQAAEKVGQRIKTKILGLSKDGGLNLVLPNGVEAYLPLEAIRPMPEDVLQSLKVDGSLEVVVTGIVGKALSVIWQAK